MFVYFNIIHLIAIVLYYENLNMLQNNVLYTMVPLSEALLVYALLVCCADNFVR